jgi:RNA polymerase sigma-70 factor, ECF subfamily
MIAPRSIMEAAQAAEPRLVARARAGDGRAQRALYDAHFDRLHHLALRLTGDDELARQCAQEALARGLLRLSTYRGDASFGTWLYRVATNVTLSRLRQLRSQRARERPLEEAGWVSSSETTKGDSFLRRRLREGLDALPEAYRVVVVMHDLEGFTHEEIGTTLGIATGTSKARLSRARARLRSRLDVCAREYAV